MRRSLLVVLLLALAVAPGRPHAQPAALPPAPPPAPASGYRVIVHPGRADSALDRRFVSDAFLKKAKTWPGGDPIRPADLGVASPTRQRFTQEILRRSVEAVRSYWQQRIFSGQDVPPPELPGDQEMLDYVARHPGGIGYVSGAAPLTGVKVVAVY